jgi:hypothetical protein
MRLKWGRKASIFSSAGGFLGFLFLLLLLIYMTSGLFSGSHFFLVKSLIFFTLCSNNGLAALDEQCKNKATAALTL